MYMGKILILQMSRLPIQSPITSATSSSSEQSSVRSSFRSTGSVKGRHQSSYVNRSVKTNESSSTYRIDEQCSIQEITCNVRDAVVSISGQIFLTEGSGTSPILTTIIKGNGFFIKGHYIICPASLVLINPSLLRTRGRFPAYSGPPTSLYYHNSTVRVSKVLVTVSNVNGCGKSYSYEADLIGVDGAGNIAVLHINMLRQWNICNPPIRNCHPFLRWGKSRNTCPGDKIILIGETSSPDHIGISLFPLTGTAENGVVVGNIADNRYVSYGGSVPGELILLSNILPQGTQQGLPVITLDGAAIGMFLHVDSLSYPYNIALSEFFMRRPVKALIRSFLDNCIPESYKDFVEPVIDPISDYYRFNKGWLGLGGILMSQDDLNTIVAHTDLSENLLIINESIINGPVCKEVLGYRVLAIANPIEDDIRLFIPGAAPTGTFVPSLKSSPLYGIVMIGDIITHINGCPLGDRKGQISPSLVMWRVRPGTTVVIKYRKQSENFEETHEATACVESYEPFLDFPWYTAQVPITLRHLMPILM